MNNRRVARSLRTTALGIFINTLLAVGKGVAGVLGNSYALVADAIESASDIFSSLVVYGGIHIASRPRDERHPYGYGKAEPMAAMVIAMALAAAGLTIAWNSVLEIITPHHAPAPFTLAVLLLVVLVKETLFRHVFSVGESVQSTAVRTDAWHHRSDAITSAAAFIGISVALIGGDGWESADDYAALLASCIILFNAYRLFVPALREVMDAAPGNALTADIRAVALAVPGVIAIDKCYIRKMGFDYFVDIHVVVNGSVTVREGHLTGHNVKDALLAAGLHVSDVLVHIEPHSFSDAPLTNAP